MRHSASSTERANITIAVCLIFSFLRVDAFTLLLYTTIQRKEGAHSRKYNIL